MTPVIRSFSSSIGTKASVASSGITRLRMREVPTISGFFGVSGGRAIRTSDCRTESRHHTCCQLPSTHPGQAELRTLPPGPRPLEHQVVPAGDPVADEHQCDLAIGREPDA